MKGEHRFDLKEILNTCMKSEYLVSSFFNVNDYNDIHFRDLYDFFDSKLVRMYCCVEAVYRNHKLEWVHNIVKDVDDIDVLNSENTKKQISTAPYFNEKNKFDERRDAEIEMFYLAFRRLEKELNQDNSTVANHKSYETLSDQLERLFERGALRDTTEPEE